MSGRKIDDEFEEATEGEEIERKERLKTKWAQIEAIVGTEDRLKLIALGISLTTSRRGWMRSRGRRWLFA